MAGFKKIIKFTLKYYFPVCAWNYFVSSYILKLFHERIILDTAGKRFVICFSWGRCYYCSGTACESSAVSASIVGREMCNTVKRKTSGKDSLRLNRVIQTQRTAVAPSLLFFPNYVLPSLCAKNLITLHCCNNMPKRELVGRAE